MDFDERIEVDEEGDCDLKYRGWEELDQGIFESSVSSRLISLDLSYNSLTSLPESIGSLASVEVLVAACNKISCISENGVGKLRKLRILKLNGNGLSALPSTIGKCQRLEQLILSENQLTALPATLADCLDLKVVKLQHNDILQLPLELTRLSDTIDTFDVSSNNNLSMIPKDVRDNASVIMWILTLYKNKRQQISQIEDTARAAMKKLQESEEAIATKENELRILKDEKQELESDIESARTFLKYRRRLECYKTKIREIKMTIRTMFNTKAAAVAIAPSS